MPESKYPTLCFLKGTNEVGACRICLVEVVGGRSLVASCGQSGGRRNERYDKFAAGARYTQVNFKVDLVGSQQDCLACIRNGNCELQDLCELFAIRENRFQGKKEPVDR